MKSDRLQVGMALTREVKVTQEMAASHLGSGSLQVLATPAMLMLIERACRSLVEAHLGSDETAVGTAVELRHLAPTPLGATVSIHVALTAIEGHLLTFEAIVSDGVELAGTATHQRVVIDVDRFLARVARKRKTLGG